MRTENIVKFLQTAYSDEKLAALLAHAQDGKLAYKSCCCFIGVATADHALRAEQFDGGHYAVARGGLPFAVAAENEFLSLFSGFKYFWLSGDKRRRKILIPLILSEMERREKLAELPDLTPSEQERQEEIEAEREGMATEMSGYADPGTERYR